MIAKSVSDSFWIIKDGNLKIGEINKTSRDGIILNIKNNYTKYKTLQDLKEKNKIKFVNNEVTRNQKNEDSVYGFPYKGVKYNEIWDLKLNLPLYTKSEESKSMFAAGYYQIKIKNKWKTILAPKLIILNRNEYIGPYKENPSYDSY